MIEDQQRPRYWLITLSILSTVAVLASVCAIIAPLFAPDLNQDSLLGFPLGFYFTAQGMVLLLIIALIWAGGRQAEVDQKFGAIEDL